MRRRAEQPTAASLASRIRPSRVAHGHRVLHAADQRLELALGEHEARVVERDREPVGEHLQVAQVAARRTPPRAVTAEPARRRGRARAAGRRTEPSPPWRAPSRAPRSAAVQRRARSRISASARASARGDAHARPRPSRTAVQRRTRRASAGTTRSSSARRHLLQRRGRRRRARRRPSAAPAGGRVRVAGGESSRSGRRNGTSSVTPATSNSRWTAAMPGSTGTRSRRAARPPRSRGPAAGPEVSRKRRRAEVERHRAGRAACRSSAARSSPCVAMSSSPAGRTTRPPSPAVDLDREGDLLGIHRRHSYQPAAAVAQPPSKRATAAPRRARQRSWSAGSASSTLAAGSARSRARRGATARPRASTARGRAARPPRSTTPRTGVSTSFSHSIRRRPSCSAATRPPRRRRAHQPAQDRHARQRLHQRGDRGRDRRRRARRPPPRSRPTRAGSRVVPRTAWPAARRSRASAWPRQPQPTIRTRAI